jgi:hypothetical protein
MKLKESYFESVEESIKKKITKVERLSYNYLLEFERIRIGDCERPFIRPTCHNKNWIAQQLIRCESYK